ncbi:hypothetical protein FBU30_007943, partial [Linnemannia zychae]
PEDAYGEYGEIHLALATKPKRNRGITEPKTTTQTKIIQPLREFPTLPELPHEILELVCTHLSQSTLRYSFNLVCKSWFHISNRFIRRAAIWKPAAGVQDILIQQWSKFNTLELWLSQDPDVHFCYISAEFTRKLLDPFLEEITKPIVTNKHSKKDNIWFYNTNKIDNSNKGATAATSCLLHSIRHLRIQGKYISYSDLRPKLHNHLQFIETLTIKTQMANPLFQILKDFTSLKSLSITADILNHGDDEDNISTTPELLFGSIIYLCDKPWITSPAKAFTDQYRLQHFTVRGVVTDLNVLERLLVTCPDLRSFNFYNSKVKALHQQHGSDIERRVRERLINIAAQFCPKLEQYSFHQNQNKPTDGKLLDDITQTLPSLKIVTLTCRDSENSIALPIKALDFLSRITVLEIVQSAGFSLNSTLLNKILCHTSSLLHLITTNVYFFSNMVEHTFSAEARNRYISATIRDRKRYERNKRQQALTCFRPSANNNSHDGDQQGGNITGYFSTPFTWQLYNLKTFDMSILTTESFEAFTTYISQNRLFCNLTRITIRVLTLQVGQLESIPQVPMATPNNSSSRAPSTVSGRHQHLGSSGSLQKPLRHPNLLLALRRLRCLEECILHPDSVPGVILSEDFEFMRRKDRFQTFNYIPKRPYSNAQLLTMTGKSALKNQQSASIYRHGINQSVSANDEKINQEQWEDEDTDDHEYMKQLERETFWPKLCVFHIYHTRALPNINSSKLIQGIEQIRPGVSIRFQRSPIHG